MSYKREIIEHYQRIWNTKPEIRNWLRGPFAELGEDFCVLEFPPEKDGEMWTYATCCMSASQDQDPVELHLFSSGKDESLVELLTAVAYFHIKTARLGLNHTVNFGRPWQVNSLCDHGFISLPYLFGPQLENGIISGIEVSFYWLLPVTEKEVAYKEKYGTEALESKFDAVDFNYLDPNRNSVV